MPPPQLKLRVGVSRTRVLAIAACNHENIFLWTAQLNTPALGILALPEADSQQYVPNDPALASPQSAVQILHFQAVVPHANMNRERLSLCQNISIWFAHI